MISKGEYILCICFGMFSSILLYLHYDATQELKALAADGVRIRAVEARIDQHDDRLKNITSRIRVLESLEARGE